MNFNEINDKTGFANGELFKSKTEIREYFKIKNIKLMFGNCPYSQFELDDMADIVIENEWHCEIFRR